MTDYVAATTVQREAARPYNPEYIFHLGRSGGGVILHIYVATTDVRLPPTRAALRRICKNSYDVARINDSDRPNKARRSNFA